MKTNNPIIVKYNPRDLPFAFRRSPLSTTQLFGASWKGFFVSENSCAQNSYPLTHERSGIFQK